MKSPFDYGFNFSAGAVLVKLCYSNLTFAVGRVFGIPLPRTLFREAPAHYSQPTPARLFDRRKR